MTNPQYLPGVTYGAEPKGHGPALHLPPRWIVIHDTGNTASARDEAHYAATRDDPRAGWTSAHFYVDDHETIGSVPLDSQAWAAFANANGHGWQIEMCGQDAGAPHAVSAATLARAAELVAILAGLGGVPVWHADAGRIASGVSGIAGHLDFTQEEHREGGHTDPGARFDWADFLHAVLTGAPPPPPAPVGETETEKIMNSLPVLKQDVGGGHAADVRNVQALTLAHHLTDQDGLPLRLDGSFGPRTTYVVAHFQALRNVANSVRADGTGDGIVGAHTWAALLNVA